ncbi:hypothetical protein [Promicromonospora sp. NPDC023805]
MTRGTEALAGEIFSGQGLGRVTTEGAVPRLTRVFPGRAPSITG